MTSKMSNNSKILYLDLNLKEWQNINGQKRYLGSNLPFKVSIHWQARPKPEHHHWSFYFISIAFIFNLFTSIINAINKNINSVS